MAINPINVLLSDASRIGCQLLKEGIEGHSEQFVIVRCATTVREVVDAANQSRADLILLSAELEDGPRAGLRALRAIREMRVPSKVIFLLDRSDRELVISAFRGGARGVFLHEQQISMLCRCMRCVHDGQIWADSSQLECLLENFAQTGRIRFVGGAEQTLTDREEQIAQLVADGLSNRDIARTLHLSEHTVKNYIFHIFDKVGVSNRVDLAMYMVRKNFDAA